jgi:hypothetical protein
MNEILEKWQRLIPEAHLLHDESAKFENAQAKTETPALRVPLQETSSLQVDDQPMNRGLVEVEAFGQLGDPEFGLLR